MKHSFDHENQIFSLIANNSYHVQSLAIQSTGFRSASLCYSERGNLNNIAEDFLLNSFFKKNDAEIENSISNYLQDEGMKLVSLIGQDSFSNVQTIELMESEGLDLSLGEAILRRRSYRNFTGDPLQLDQVATLLRAANGISAIGEAPFRSQGCVKFHLRTVASGGGLYPIELYFASINIDSLAKGIYRYHPQKDQLICLGDKQKMFKLLEAFDSSVNLIQESNASLLLLFVAKPWRSMRKYGCRGLRFVLHETGAITQNIHLATTALGLGSVDCASFYEDDAHQVLNFDGLSQVILHSLLVGVIP